MTRSNASAGPAGRRRLALLGLTGALLSAAGDVLILGRRSSGRDFDRAAGMVPAHIDAEDRWRSLWNGAGLPARRVRAGAVVGDVGIGLLQGLALLGTSRTLGRGPERRVATAAAAAFAVSGVLTHQCCAAVILAYQRAGAEAAATDGGVRPSPPSATGLLGVSAAGSLAALAAFSASLLAAARRRGDSGRAWWSTPTPFPLVLVTLLSFGRLPAPVGGYARPASISLGLLTYFALAAARRR